MKRSFPFFMFFTSSWLALALAFAGAQGQKPPVFRAGINIVQTDVTVLGPDGRPLHGLTADDFELYEDGEPVEILGFAEVDLPDSTDSPGWMRTSSPDVRRALDGRVLVFLLDDAQVPYSMEPGSGFIHPDERIAAVERITEQFINRMGPQDVAAVICVYDKRCDQDFTSDRTRLRGRRTIVYISPHLPTRPAIFPPPNNIWDTTTLQILKTFEAAMKAGITVYGVNPTSLLSLAQAPPDDPDAPEAERARFSAPTRSLSAETGGFNISRPDQFEDGVAQIFRETGSYYLLGYEPPAKKDTGYNMLKGLRELEVRVKRPGLTVKAHRGYIAVLPTKTPKNPPAESTSALAGVLPKTDLPLRVTAAPFHVPGQPEALVAIALGISEPASSVQARDYIDVQIRAFTTRGDQRAMKRVHVDARFAPSRDGTALTEVVSELHLRPGRYELRLSAYSERMAESGSVYTDLEVPDFAKLPLALSGVALMSFPKPESVAPDPLSSLLPVVPTTQREFSRTAVVRAHVRVYQGGKLPPAAVALHTTILDEKSAIVFDRTETLAPDQFGATRSSDVRVDVPVAQLAPGWHRLRIEATIGGGAPVFRDVQFRVVSSK